jgi:hypothetical protein
MPSSNSSHIRHLKQGVSITGFGLEDFQSQLDMVPDIAALFTRAVDEDKIQPNSIVGELEELSTLNASNRYFTPRKDARTAKELAFHSDVDPYGNLSRLLGPMHTHIEENNVSYYERVGNTKYAITVITLMIALKVCRYISVKPASVSIGDLVELQVSFIMVPLRGNKFKATMVLRSILVLDRTYTQVKDAHYLISTDLALNFFFFFFFFF